MLKRVLNKNLLNFRKCMRNLATHEINTNILLSDSSNVDIPDITIPEFILPKLEQYAKHTASECAITGKSYTFGQVRLKSKNLNKALRHIFKLENSDVVAILLPNRPEFIISVLGIFEAGLILTTINPIYTPEEISKHLLDSSAKVLITHSNAVQTAKAAINLMKKNIPIIAIKVKQNESLPQGIIDFDELVNLNLDVPEVDYGKSGDITFLPYSSGTTGFPKGVAITHNNIIANICQITHDDFNYFDPPTDNFQDVTAAVLPFYHIYGFVLSFLNMAYNGAKTVTIEKFSSDLYISVLKKHPVSIIYAAPPLVLFFTTHPEVKSEYFNSLKMITSGAAPLGFLDEERFIKKIGKNSRIIQGYGLTETSPIVTYTPKLMKRTKENGGTVGKPIPNTQIKIISPSDPTGRPLGLKESGEILVKGPQVMNGYYNRDEETKNAFLDGWFRTGDVGYYNEDKLIFVTDRIKELIKVKGYQVAPAELEEIIRDYPAVEDAAVIGIPHPKYGEVPRAYVVSKGTVDADLLKKYVAEKVASFKQLQGGVEIVEAIPKNPSGKILRRQLKDEYLKKGY